jgi:hypothetical protein
MLQSIHEYYTQVQRIRNFGDTNNKLSIRTAFIELLNKYAPQKGLEVVAEKSEKHRMAIL